MKKLYEISKKYPILAGIVGFLVIYLSFMYTPSTPDPNSYELAVLKIILAIACTGFIALISGDKILVNSSNRTGYGILIGIPLIMVNGAFSLVGLILDLVEAEPIAHGWFIQGLLLAFSCLSLGFFEETLFRALINDAILYQFRNKKGVFVAIAIISSFVFGILHVLGSDVHNFLTFLQAFLKTISCAMSGFLFLTIYWKTHNIVACAIVHALCDFIPSVSTFLFSKYTELDSYVLEGETDYGAFKMDAGLTQSIGQIIQIILTIIAFLIMLKFIKKIDFKKIREEW